MKLQSSHHLLVLLSVRAVLGYCQYGSILPNLAAICASIYHTIHTVTLTLTLILTLNLTLTLNLRQQCTLSVVVNS